MEHTCQRCGSSVDDSAPFCGSCAAPQIRFSGRVGRAPTVRVAVPVSLIASPIQPEAYSPSTINLERNGRASLDRGNLLRAAIAAGVIAGLLSMLPLGFILGSPLGGFLSVLLYRRRSWSADPSRSAGFRLGALSGLFGFVVFAVLASMQVLLQKGNEVRDAMIEAVRWQQARNPDPQARQMLDYLLTPHGFILTMMIGLIVMGLLFVLLSGIGGSISAALLRRKEPPR